MKQDIFILPNSSLYFALQKLQATGLKCLIVIDKKKKLLGTISDGDIRRAIINRTKVSSKINKIYNKNCLFIYESLIDMQSIQKKMDLDSIDIVPVVNKKKLIIDYIKKDEFKNFVPSNNKKNLDKKVDINLEVVIMAGGEGTRLRPFTSILPKALIPLKEKTVIEKIIENFLKFQFKKFIISINYKSVIIKSFFKELNPKFKYKFLVEKKKLGTAGCLYLLKNNIKKDYLIVNCDSLLDFNYADFCLHHKENKNDITLVVSVKKFTIPYGTCVLNEKGLIKSFNEKPNQHFLVNTGMYIINNQIFKFIKNNQYLDFNDLIMLSKKRKKKIGVFPVSEKSWQDVGQWKDYSDALKMND